MDNAIETWLEQPWTSSYLPKRVSYDDIIEYRVENEENGITISPNHIFHFLLSALIITALRRLYETKIAFRLAAAVGLKNTRKKPGAVPELENAYATTKSPSDAEMLELSKKLDLRERYVRNWYRLRRNQDLPSVTDKFIDASWRLTYYVFGTLPFIIKVTSFPWFHDRTLCWVGYPYQPVSQDAYYYYMLCGGYYISLMAVVGTDIRRKDYWAMVLHHAVTVILITGSYMVNMVRIGTLVLAIHDITHINLQLAKLLLYTKFVRASNIFFGIFAVVYLVSFLYINPCYILYAAFVDSANIVGPCKLIAVFNIFLFTLQGLHMYWTTTLIRMIVRMVRNKEGVKKDARSNDEEEEEEDDD